MPKDISYNSFNTTSFKTYSLNNEKSSKGVIETLKKNLESSENILKEFSKKNAPFLK